MIFNESGGTSLNFKVLNGVTEPTNPKENTIWVNTDREITGWHFGADEPNVYDIQTESNYRWKLYAPHPLRDGDILNFTIPSDVTDQLEAIRLQDSAGKEYYVRQGSGSAVAAWPAGTKVGVRISNDLHPIKGWVGHGTAYLMVWGSYYHEEGTLWISTGIDSQVAFNAAKKGVIMVYPLSAKQMVSGTLVNVTAKSWQNGKWVDWIYHLYNPGDNGDVFYVYTPPGSYAGRVSTVFDSDGISLKNTVGTNYYGVRIASDEKIDLSDYSKLYAKVKFNSISRATGLWTCFGVTSDRSGTASKYSAITTHENIAVGEHLYEVDISGVNTPHYFECGFDTTSCTFDAKIVDIWFE